MTSKTSYTKEEWAQMMKAPFYAGSIVAISDMGRADLRKERHAAVKGATLWEIPLAARDLLRPLYADIGKFRGDTDRLPGYTDFEDPGSWKREALEKLGEVIAILKAKATPEEIAAFKEWVIYVAQTTADASKEGALGLVGPRVSDAEQAALDEIREILDAND
jgi:hypothetical protein